MRAVIKAMDLDPNPATLSADPARFEVMVQLLIGLADGPGEKSFQVTVRTPEWLAAKRREANGICDPRHHLIVNLHLFDKGKLGYGSRAASRRSKHPTGMVTIRRLAHRRELAVSKDSSM